MIQKSHERYGHQNNKDNRAQPEEYLMQAREFEEVSDNDTQTINPMIENHADQAPFQYFKERYFKLAHKETEGPSAE